MSLEDEFDPDKRQRKYTIKNPEQVLVRLKVEHSGFTTLNNQRFGSRFVGEVVSLGRVGLDEILLAFTTIVRSCLLY
jgi:hypothetical protein